MAKIQIWRMDDGTYQIQVSKTRRGEGLDRAAIDVSKEDEFEAIETLIEEFAQT